MNETTFECRCCGAHVIGEASSDGPTKVGWFLLEGVDGPSAVCQGCRAEGDSVLDVWREDFPNIRFARQPLEVINDLLHLDLGPTVRGDEAKGWCPDPDDVGRMKFYLGRKDCLALSEAFKKLANELREVL